MAEACDLGRLRFQPFQFGSSDATSGPGLPSFFIFVDGIKELKKAHDFVLDALPTSFSEGDLSVQSRICLLRCMVFNIGVGATASFPAKQCPGLNVSEARTANNRIEGSNLFDESVEVS